MDLLVTGYIRSSHGLDGFLKVESASGEVAHFADMEEISLRAKGSDGPGKAYEIEAVEGSSALLLLKLKGIDTPEAAKALSGMELVVPRDKACPLEEDEWYVDDLCQCMLVYEGNPVGKIAGVMEGGAGDLLQVILSEGSNPDTSGGKTCLVPMRHEFIGKVDLQSKTVELMHRWILEQ